MFPGSPVPRSSVAKLQKTNATIESLLGGQSLNPYLVSLGVGRVSNGFPQNLINLLMMGCVIPDV